MSLQSILSKLRENDIFKGWQEAHKEVKLVHLFTMLETGTESKLDIGFYDYNSEKMTSFTMDENVESVEQRTDEEVFKKEDDQILPLEEDKIKIDMLQACDICSKVQQEEYSIHKPMKQVIILQHLSIGQIWNITYITKQFKTLNFKVDAENGNVIEHKLHEIFSFDK
ncbi:hypothetical protein HQ545_08575 [Candidatus Woesearchaeota archaeon]|nr:hypothetical protein [Candidatus Woesearchaeota archaeon]